VWNDSTEQENKYARDRELDANFSMSMSMSMTSAQTPSSSSTSFTAVDPSPSSTTSNQMSNVTDDEANKVSGAASESPTGSPLVAVATATTSSETPDSSLSATPPSGTVELSSPSAAPSGTLELSSPSAAPSGTPELSEEDLERIQVMNDNDLSLEQEIELGEETTSEDGVQPQVATDTVDFASDEESDGVDVDTATTAPAPEKPEDLRSVPPETISVPIASASNSVAIGIGGMVGIAAAAMVVVTVLAVLGQQILQSKGTPKDDSAGPTPTDL
jgi:hypothetical protein